MSENTEKRYCVVDHANKYGERQGKNPNRLKQIRERQARWGDAGRSHKGKEDPTGGR